MEQPNQFAGLRVTELLLDSGEYVYIKPLSIYLLRALNDKAEEQFPYPDATAYERELDPEKAVLPGQKVPASENPDYRRLVDEADTQRKLWMNDQVITLCVEPAAGRETLMAKYKEPVKALRKIITVPDDPWEAILKLCVIVSRQDHQNILKAMNTVFLVGEEDIRDGMRIFRPTLRRNRLAHLTRQQGPPGLPAIEPVNPQPADGGV